ncbi:telomere repeats-binding bouquet formation protein 1 [Ciona intestinalis]
MADYDLNVLLEFLKPDPDGFVSSSNRLSSQIYSLEALASMCSSNGSHAEEMKACGGIDLVLDLLYNATCGKLQQPCMFMLACAAEANVHVQQYLTQDKIFGLIQTAITGHNNNDVGKTIALFFLLCLVSQNKQGQLKISTSGCLKQLMDQFVNYYKMLANSKVGKEKVKHWNIVIKTLSYSVNIPQNEMNQNIVSKLVPWIIATIHRKHSNELTKHCCKLLSVVIENNSQCQTIAFTSQAVAVLILLLKDSSESGNCGGECVNALSCLLQGEAATDEQKVKFITLGGLYLVMELIKQDLNEHWVLFHVNQSLNLLNLCIDGSGTNIEKIPVQKIANCVTTLIDKGYGDECLNQQSIKLLRKIYDFGIKSKANVSIPKKGVKQITSKKDVCLDIRGTNKTALRRSSGVFESPTDKVHVHLKRPSKKTKPPVRRGQCSSVVVPRPMHSHRRYHQPKYINHDLVSVCSEIIDSEVDRYCNKF